MRRSSPTTPQPDYEPGGWVCPPPSMRVGPNTQFGEEGRHGGRRGAPRRPQQRKRPPAEEAPAPTAPTPAYGRSRPCAEAPQHLRVALKDRLTLLRCSLRTGTT